MPPATAERLRVAVIEDDPRYRRSLEALFHDAPGFSLAASFTSAEAALDEAHQAGRTGGQVPWDVVLMDLQLPGLGGIEATRRLKTHRPTLLIVVLTVFEDPATILAAICGGADGYILKKAPAGEILAQLRSTAGGGAALTAAVARTVLELLRRESRPGRAAGSPTRLDLTDRERQVLQCLVRGHSYKQAAEELGVSIDTVRTHIRGVYQKLQVHSVAEAVGRAIRERLV